VDKNLGIAPEARLRDLRQQHEQWQRAGYDGHNRHPLRTTMRRLRKRRDRRRAQRFLYTVAHQWSFGPMTQWQEVA